MQDKTKNQFRKIKITKNRIKKTPKIILSLLIIKVLVFTSYCSEKRKSVQKKNHNATIHEHYHEHEKEHNHEHNGKTREKIEQQKKKEEKEKKKIFYCPMHPNYTSDKPGKCPICGMDLIEKKESEKNEEEKTSPEKSIFISPQKLQLIGVSFTRVLKEEVEKEIRIYGYISYDERKIVSITPRFSGWIEKLYANFEGKEVRKGEPLAKIYSPEILSSFQDYLILKKQHEKSGDEKVKETLSELLKSAKKKILLYDLPQVEIERLLKEPSPYIIIRSPSNGVVIEKKVFEGSYFQAGSEMFKIADLSQLWFIGEVYEKDIRDIKENEKINILITSVGKTYSGKIEFIYPHVEKEVRTIKIRVSLRNDDGKLKPYLYSYAYIKIPLGKQLTIPESSVIISGEKTYVFIKGEKEGELIPKEIKLGQKLKEKYIVESGLNEGDEVVSSGVFLIDSESKLKYALESFGGMHEHGKTHENSENQKDAKNKTQNKNLNEQEKGGHTHGKQNH
jgi:multidrug efflux pump subunit AcrA (membrane-fusion protein)